MRSSPPVDDIARYFTRMAPAFDAYYREPSHGIIGRVGHAVFRKPGLVRRFEATMTLLQPIAGKKVLDVGCGPGAYSIYLWRQGARVTGIDLTPAMLELADAAAAEAGWTEPDFRVADAMRFTHGAPYDAAIAIGVFDYLDDETREPFLRHLTELTPGPVIATFPKLLTPQSFVRRLYFVGKETPVYFYREAAVTALAQAVDRVPLFVDCGPIWTVSFAPIA